MAVARLARVERYFRTNENGHAETGGRINRCLRDANIANQGKAINLREVRGESLASTSELTGVGGRTQSAAGTTTDLGSLDRRRFSLGCPSNASQRLPYPVALTHPSYGTRQLVDAAMMLEKIRLNPTITTNSIAILKLFAKSDLGYSLLPPFSIATELAAGELKSNSHRQHCPP